MEIDRELYERVFSLATVIVNVVEDEHSDEFEKLYFELRNECEQANASDKKHPFFLETLADFTLEDSEALEIYSGALTLAEELDLPDYCASISFAMAERYHDLNQPELAHGIAKKAREHCRNTKDEKLLEEIEEFIVSTERST